MVCCFKRVVLSCIALLCKHGKVIIEVLARTHMFTSSAAPCHNPDTLSKHSSHLSSTVCKAMISSVLHFSIHCTLQSGVWSQLRFISRPGLEAQVHVVCDRTKLVGVLFEKKAQRPVVGSLGQITKSANL